MEGCKYPMLDPHGGLRPAGRVEEEVSLETSRPSLLSHSGGRMEKTYRRETEGGKVIGEGGKGSGTAVGMTG